MFNHGKSQATSRQNKRSSYDRFLQCYNSVWYGEVALQKHGLSFDCDLRYCQSCVHEKKRIQEEKKIRELRNIIFIDLSAMTNN